MLRRPEDPMFKEHIDTETMDLYEVVENIGKKLQVTMFPDNSRRFTKFLRRTLVTVKHIRL